MSTSTLAAVTTLATVERVAELRDAIERHDFEVERAAVKREHDYALNHAPHRTVADYRAWLNGQVAAFNEKFGGIDLKRAAPFRGNVVDLEAQATSQAQIAYDIWRAQQDELDAEAAHWDQPGKRALRVFDADPAIETMRAELAELVTEAHAQAVAERNARREKIGARIEAVKAAHDEAATELALARHAWHSAVEDGEPADDLYDAMQELAATVDRRAAELVHLDSALADVAASWPGLDSMLPKRPQARDIVQCFCAFCRGTGKRVA